MGPIDYSGAFPQQNVLQNIQQGYQLGSAIRQDQQAQDQAKIAQQQALQYKVDIQAAMKSPTPQNFAALALKYPKEREAFKQSFDQLSEGERKSQGDAAAQAYSALLSNRPDIAIDSVQKRIDGLKNSGMDSSHEEQILDQLKSNPENAKAALGFTLAHITDPKTFSQTFGNLGSEQRAQDQAPAELAKKQADATIAGSKAKYADSEALLDLEKKGWDIKAIQEDMGFKRESNRIAAMNAAANRESNGLKRQELQLKIQDTIAARDQKVQEKVDQATSGISSIDNILNTIDSVKNHPGLGKAVGVKAAFPTTPGSDAADFEAKIETLGSQAFLSQISAFKGMGALSDAEGKKLTSGLANLSIKQSEAQLRKNIDDIERIMTNARANIAKKNGVPETVAGGGIVLSSPRYGELNESQVREFAKAKGLTRDQAIQVINTVK